MPLPHTAIHTHTPFHTQLEGRLELSDSEAEWEAMFADLIDKMLVLDPEKRITVSEALKHKFITTRFV